MSAAPVSAGPVYVVLGEPHNDVHAYDDPADAATFYTALIGANLDAEVVPVPRARWEDGGRAALTAVLAGLDEPGHLYEHSSSSSSSSRKVTS